MYCTVYVQLIVHRTHSHRPHAHARIHGHHAVRMNDICTYTRIMNTAWMCSQKVHSMYIISATAFFYLLSSKHCKKYWLRELSWHRWLWAPAFNPYVTTACFATFLNIASQLKLVVKKLRHLFYTIENSLPPNKTVFPENPLWRGGGGPAYKRASKSKSPADLAPF